MTIEQAVRVPVAEWTPRQGPAEIICWGVFRSGLLRHPLFIGWQEAPVPSRLIDASLPPGVA